MNINVGFSRRIFQLIIAYPLLYQIKSASLNMVTDFLYIMRLVLFKSTSEDGPSLKLQNSFFKPLEGASL
ncbi:hypothetical protein IOC57_09015 [Bacillus sp. SD075]|uniref:hypothetical protein n=1 Tax=Bacillus sp. SD075 TaxID=2781732 RepID=UPI001A96834E|nr:hypothetical protein [Bacillus sp. SD075]MBO0997886.1 hypothetical protein [Bacillus sp. SD075]